MYEKILKRAEQIAREFHYGKLGSGTGGGGYNRWILANGAWDDRGTWMDDKHWRDG